MNMEQYLDNAEVRVHKADARWLARQDAMDVVYDHKIGELTREGKTVYYIIDRSGKVRESECKFELQNFLDRNDYAWDE